MHAGAGAPTISETTERPRLSRRALFAAPLAVPLLGLPAFAKPQALRIELAADMEVLLSPDELRRRMGFPPIEAIDWAPATFHEFDNRNLDVAEVCRIFDVPLDLLLRDPLHEMADAGISLECA